MLGSTKPRRPKGAPFRSPRGLFQVSCVSQSRPCSLLAHLVRSNASFFRHTLKKCGATPQSRNHTIFPTKAEPARCKFGHGPLPCGLRAMRGPVYSRLTRLLRIYCHGNLFRSQLYHFVLLQIWLTQVLEAWCGRAKALAECGLALEDWAGSASTNDHDNGRAVDLQQSLSEIKDLTMAALVHPAKFISSMAPVLLEHVVWLRHVSGNISFR